MKKKYPPALLKVSRRVVWFKTPEEALQDTRFFLTQVMTYGTLEDVVTAKAYYSPQAFKQALADLLPGVFDARSWAYWNAVFGQSATPAMPKRHI